MTDALLMCPESVLLYISTYLGPSDWSSLGNLCVSIARERNELWIEIFAWKFVIMNACSSRKRKGKTLVSSVNSAKKNSRTTRSESNPRLAFFNAMRNRMYAFDHCATLMIAAMRKSDSPKTISKILLPDFPVNRLFVPFSDSTLLGAAVRFRRWRVAKYIVADLGANMNTQDQNGMNPIITLAWWGDFWGVKKLFKISHLMLRKYEVSSELDLTSVNSLHNGVDSPDNSGLRFRRNRTNNLYGGSVERSGATGHWKNFVIDLDLVGCPSMTSVCGGSGPYNAEEWARRKSIVCPENDNFSNIVDFLMNERTMREP